MTDELAQPEPERGGKFDREVWRTVGITEVEGKSWWRHRIEPSDALRWRRAGVTQAIDAVRWKIAGVDPSTVREWVYAEIDAREAVVWAELGFNAAGARVNKRAGRSPVQAYGRQSRNVAWTPMPSSARPSTPHAAAPRGVRPRQSFLEAVMRRHPQQRHLVHSYMSRQWCDDEAMAWAIHGIEAGDALAWKELGLTPVEAERQQARGNNAMQTAKAWWRAGIPVDEVADWIGAGLTPTEAAEQRANGVTAERAAVLRSLRKDENAAD